MRYAAEPLLLFYRAMPPPLLHGAIRLSTSLSRIADDYGTSTAFQMPLFAACCRLTSGQR